MTTTQSTEIQKRHLEFRLTLAQIAEEYVDAALEEATQEVERLQRKLVQARAEVARFKRELQTFNQKEIEHAPDA